MSSDSKTLDALGMSGSFPLDAEAIDAALTREGPGNYALGFLDGDGFQVFYVGRSDDDVRKRLHEWVGVASHGRSFAAATRAPWGARRRGRMPLGIPVASTVESGESCYTRFAFSYADSAEDAFANECRHYDDFGGRRLDNPAPPSIHQS